MCLKHLLSGESCCRKHWPLWRNLLQKQRSKVSVLALQRQDLTWYFLQQPSTVSCRRTSGKLHKQGHKQHTWLWGYLPCMTPRADPWRPPKQDQNMCNDETPPYLHLVLMRECRKVTQGVNPGLDLPPQRGPGHWRMNWTLLDPRRWPFPACSLSLFPTGLSLQIKSVLSSQYLVSFAP